MNTLNDHEFYLSLKKTPIKDISSEALNNPTIFNMVYNRCSNYGDFCHLLKFSPLHLLEEVIIDIAENQEVAIEDIPEPFLHIADVVLPYMEDSIHTMCMLPEKFKDDEDFINCSAIYNGNVLQYASTRVKNIEYIIDNALHSNPECFMYIPNKFKTETNCLLSLNIFNQFQTYPDNWLYMPDDLTHNDEFIKKAGKICPQIFKHLDKNIKDRYDITEYFLTLSGNNLQYVKEEFANNQLLVNLACDNETHCFKHAGHHIKNDIHFVSSILKQDPSQIYHCGEYIKTSYNIAKQVCNEPHYGFPISFFDEIIRSDITIGMISLLCMPASMKFLSSKLSLDEDFIDLYIQQEKFNPDSLAFLPIEMKNNLSIMLSAYKKNYISLEHVGDNLKSNTTFLNHIFAHEVGNNTLENKNLRNLKLLNLQTGDEPIVLNFLQNTYGDNIHNIHNLTLNSKLLFNITNHNFKNILNEQENIYAYVKAVSLTYALNNTLINKSESIQKHKTKI